MKGADDAKNHDKKDDHGVHAAAVAKPDDHGVHKGADDAAKHHAEPDDHGKHPAGHK